MTQAAWAAGRVKDDYLSAQFWRLARRIGKKKAVVAVAHSILVIANPCSAVCHRCAIGPCETVLAAAGRVVTAAHRAPSAFETPTI